MARATLLDIARLNGHDKVVGLIEENLTYAPELNVLPARTIAGTSYKITTRSAYPGVGFRNANEGTTPTKSTLTSKLVECYILNAVIQADKAVADSYEDGPAAWQMIEADGVMRQAMIEVGAQVFQGTNTDSKGFPGLQEIHTAFGTSIVVDAGGTTAGTGSSVYACKLGPQGVQLIFGANTTFNLGAFRDQQITSDNSTYFDAYVASLTSWVGMQAASPNCVGRIKDLTEDSGKGLTDSVIANLLSKFPVGYMPDVFFMSRRSARQLQQSRTVTINAGPSGGSANGLISNIVSMPTEAFGIPIVVTDSITDTETLS